MSLGPAKILENVAIEHGFVFRPFLAAGGAKTRSAPQAQLRSAAQNIDYPVNINKTFAMA
jgi:hypothetical protein